jgi:hypothetical protein
VNQAAVKLLKNRSRCDKSLTNVSDCENADIREDVIDGRSACTTPDVSPHTIGSLETPSIVILLDAHAIRIGGLIWGVSD